MTDYIDRAFAKAVMKQCGGDERQEALLIQLFSLARQGHLAAQIEPDCPLPSPWVCRFENYLYLQKNWAYETRILTHLQRLHSSVPSIPLPSIALDPRLNAAQRQAVENGARHALSLITGGPGTGKTFTAAELAKACLSHSPLRIVLAAPTGKAASHLEANLRKTLGSEADILSGTLHSLLRIKAHAHEEEEAAPLLADLIIVDESSMIDAKIFARLLAAVPTGSRLVLIGDKDQLPPVEAGSIFADLVDAQAFPVSLLTECLRSDRAEILAFSQQVRDGNVDAALLDGSDVAWTQEETLPQLWARFKSHFPLTPEIEHLSRFVLLSCTREGRLGVDSVNRFFFEQHRKAAPLGSYLASPILMTRNDYDLELYNGDLGYLVRQVTGESALQLSDYALFLDRKGGVRKIAALALGAFEYSYCLSVHKSQGSEYDEVHVLLPPGSERFGREVLYTAATRARKRVTLSGSKDLFMKAIALSSRRTSGIIARLKKSF